MEDVQIHSVVVSFPYPWMTYRIDQETIPKIVNVGKVFSSCLRSNTGPPLSPCNKSLSTNVLY